MPNKYRLCSRLALLCLALALAGLFAYTAANYINVGLRLYPRNAQTLDLTGRKLGFSQIEKLQKKLPGCEIIWDVPLSGGSWPSNSRELTLGSLEEADVAALAWFPELTVVDARECTDYEPLLRLIAAYSQLEVRYIIRLGQDRFSPNTRKIQVRGITQGEILRLQGMPNLEEVVCAGGYWEAVQDLQVYCRETGIRFVLRAGDGLVSEDMAEAELTGVEADQIALLGLMQQLRRLYLTEPQVTAGELIALRKALPGTDVDWQVTVGGVTASSDQEELDLSRHHVEEKQIRQLMEWFPDAQRVYLGSSRQDNETLAALREQLRSCVKLVWQVSLGTKLTARTDDKSFMPVREHVYYFNDEEAYNLRYCEDMEAIDIGHMSIHNIDFVEFMPNLTYLILAHTQLQYIEPISTCKNLKFLELDWSPVRDLSPLVGCTGLEDLNLGQTFASFEPVKQMTWLKNLWVINCNEGTAYRMAQALPNTKVQGSGDATVASGWRRLPNYYAMRDALGMYYMSWG